MAGLFTHSGDFSKLEKFLHAVQRDDFFSDLARYGQEGVNALAANTPKDSGLTAASWGYEIEGSGDSYKITWTNTNRNGNVNIAIIRQYGHGTGTGGWVQGIDYINPATKSVMTSIVDNVWKKVQSA